MLSVGFTPCWLHHHWKCLKLLKANNIAHGHMMQEQHLCLYVHACACVCVCVRVCACVCACVWTYRWACTSTKARYGYMCLYSPPRWSAKYNGWMVRCCWQMSTCLWGSMSTFREWGPSLPRYRRKSCLHNQCRWPSVYSWNGISLYSNGSHCKTTRRTSFVQVLCQTASCTCV